MTRPLRIEFSGALYHVTSRGNGKEAIFFGDDDRQLWLEIIGMVAKRFNWVIHAYCQMTNHYHLLVETPDANLALGMRQLNGVYTQRINRIHKRAGHLFQGRYQAVLVQKEHYLLELSRYIVLNPVRAQMVAFAADWPWSSYRSMAGITPAPNWLETDWLLASFFKQKKKAKAAYIKFVSEGENQLSPWHCLKNQIYLGSEDFVKQMQAKIRTGQHLNEIPKSQYRPIAKPLAWYFQTYPNRNSAIVEAFRSGAYNMREIGEYIGLHYSRISRIIKSEEKA